MTTRYCEVCDRNYKNYSAHLKTKKHAKNISKHTRMSLKERCFLFWKCSIPFLVKDVVTYIFSLVAQNMEVWRYYDACSYKTRGIFLTLRDAIHCVKYIEGKDISFSYPLIEKDGLYSGYYIIIERIGWLGMFLKYKMGCIF